MAIRVAGSVVGRLEETPLTATPAQQLLLGAAAARLRAAAGTILVSSQSDRAESLESRLGDLVSRTLVLVDAAMAMGQPPVISPHGAASAPPALTEGERTTR